MEIFTEIGRNLLKFVEINVITRNLYQFLLISISFRRSSLPLLSQGLQISLGRRSLFTIHPSPFTILPSAFRRHEVLRTTTLQHQQLGDLVIKRVTLAIKQLSKQRLSKVNIAQSLMFHSPLSFIIRLFTFPPLLRSSSPPFLISIFPPFAVAFPLHPSPFTLPSSRRCLSSLSSALRRSFYLLPDGFYFLLFTFYFLLFTLHCLFASPTNFTVDQGSTLTFSSNNFITFETTGTITLNGTLEAGCSEIKVGQRWEKATDGKFDYGVSTVTFYTTVVSTLTGQTTFYCLRCEDVGKELQFTAGTTQWITTTFTMTGGIGGTIKLRSTNPASKWAVTFNSTQTVNYIDVKDSDANQFPVGCSNSQDTGNNNENWVFPPNAPSGLTQLALVGDTPGPGVLASMVWTDSNLIISSFTLSTPNPNNAVKYRLEITSVTTAGGVANWSLPMWQSQTSSFISQGTTGYQWQSLTESTTYWWRVWCENKLGVVSSSDTLVVDNKPAKLGFSTSLSVDILLDNYNFGEVPLGTSTQTIAALDLSGSSITVRNTGNIVENFAIKIETDTADTPWYSDGSAPGYNQFVMMAGFHGISQPPIGLFGVEDIISTGTYKTCTGSVFSINGSETGVNVPVGITKHLWLRLDMPISSATAAPQRIKLFIRAENP